MKFRSLLVINWIFCLLVLLVVYSQSSQELKEKDNGLDGPGQFIAFHKEIRTPIDVTKPEYKPGFIVRELAKAKALAARTRNNARTQTNGVLEWKERGPANVPGRTRGLIVDPDDATKNTWFAGSVGGGVWKTTNGGTNWSLLTPELPNLSTSVLAMAPSNPNIIYLGTGESFGGLPGIRGAGMFKSTDRGITWNLITATVDFSDINRLAVDPANANIVVAATSSGIYKTMDGGDTWTQTSILLGIEDLKATPGNFNIQYAAQNGIGVLKSTDAGNTWANSNTGMSPAGRLELGISPVNTSRIFASAEGNVSGTGSDLYVSSDAGATWSLVRVAFNSANVNFLGGQGWYDNTVLCDPLNADNVYLGGVSLFRVHLESGSTTTNNYSVEEQNTSFLTMVNFGAGFYGGRLEIGLAANASVEVRFGPGRTQKAHRFLVPETATSGVPDANYAFADYVDVPFEVWDITNNRQLMVSFRDQDRNGQFNLLLQNTEGSPTTQSREYIYINNIDYATSPNSSVTVNGGHTTSQMYFFWPVLTAGKTWPNDITSSNLRITFSSVPLLNASTVTVADAYNQFDGKNRFNTFGSDVHPDHHNLTVIPISANTYKLLNASDGGIFVSNASATPGINQGDWTMVGLTYNTSQFYGADKRPGFDQYFGGMQDNGTWRSPDGMSANSSTGYQFSLGGDGFEVVWHKLDDKKLIGGAQGNLFSRSIDGGNSWSSATSGLSGIHPFISKLANSASNPDGLYTLSSAGVFRSTNFGASWTLTPITEKWGSSSLMDVEVSRANANIIWAGSGMVNSGTLRNIHVSTNGGASFSPVNNYTDITLGGITKLASHPTKDSTAYALFSFAGRPKILRTTNLGQTWQDISGFNTSVSNNGFPNVAVYCLYVRPDNTDIIWAGTEIGIVESLDNGATWTLLNDFPNVAVWDMKGQDDQVVIATHGRGIWTATINAPQLELMNPHINEMGTSPKSHLSLNISLKEDFDSTWVYIQEQPVGKLTIPSGDYVLTIPSVSAGIVTARLISYKNSAPFYSNEASGVRMLLNPITDQYSNHFKTGSDFDLTSFLVQPFGNANSSLQSLHHYTANSTAIAVLKTPVRIANENALFFYRDVALVEPGLPGSTHGQPEFKDYVIAEGSKDGVTWVPLAPGYDARFHSGWLAAYNNIQAGTVDHFVDQQIDLLNIFQPGDTVLFRFRLFSDASITGWGWSIDELYIQQTPTGVQEPPVVNQLEVFPNPSAGRMTVSFNLVKPGPVNVEITDFAGRNIAQLNLGHKNTGYHKTEINISQKGMFLLTVNTGTGKKSMRILVKD